MKFLLRLAIMLTVVLLLSSCNGRTFQENAASGISSEPSNEAHSAIPEFSASETIKPHFSKSTEAEILEQFDSSETIQPSVPTSLGQFVVRVIDRDNTPVVNACITIAAMDNEHKAIEAFTNSLGHAKLNWPDANYCPFTYGDYSVEIAMNRPNCLKAIQESVVLQVTTENVQQPIDLKLQNKSTNFEYKSATPRVEITILDEQGNSPSAPLWLIADFAGATSPDTESGSSNRAGYLDAQGKIIFTDMPIGEYQLAVLDDGGPILSNFVFEVISTSEATNFTFQLND